MAVPVSVSVEKKPAVVNRRAGMVSNGDTLTPCFDRWWDFMPFFFSIFCIFKMKLFLTKMLLFLLQKHIQKIYFHLERSLNQKPAKKR